MLIAAIRRTGSTLLAEALSELPRAYVFREPKLFRGRVTLKADDLARLPVDLDLGAGDREVKGARDAALTFRDEVVRPLSKAVEQIGIKEVRYGPRWPDVLDVLREIAPLRVVALGRDPRDMYLSLVHRARVRRVPLRGTLGPEAVAEDIEREFAWQLDLIEATSALAVRYEDLCTDPSVLRAIRSHVGSPLGGDGSIGAFKPEEHAIHGGRVSDLQVRRWERETDDALRAQADAVMRRLGAYREFWGYGA